MVTNQGFSVATTLGRAIIAINASSQPLIPHLYLRIFENKLEYRPHYLSCRVAPWDHCAYKLRDTRADEGKSDL